MSIFTERAVARGLAAIRGLAITVQLLVLNVLPDSIPDGAVGSPEHFLAEAAFRFATLVYCHGTAAHHVSRHKGGS